MPVWSMLFKFLVVISVWVVWYEYFTFFLGPFFLVWSVINSVAWAYGATQALPWTTVVLLMALWVFSESLYFYIPYTVQPAFCVCRSIILLAVLSISSAHFQPLIVWWPLSGSPLDITSSMNIIQRCDLAMNVSFKQFSLGFGENMPLKWR